MVMFVRFVYLLLVPPVICPLGRMTLLRIHLRIGVLFLAPFGVPMLFASAFGVQMTVFVLSTHFWLLICRPFLFLLLLVCLDSCRAYVSSGASTTWYDGTALHCLPPVLFDCIYLSRSFKTIELPSPTGGISPDTRCEGY